MVRGSLFCRKHSKTEKCVWTAQACTDCIWAHPVKRSGRPKNRRTKEYISEVVFWGSKYENMWKNGPKMSPKRWGYFGGEPLRALLAHLWRSKSFFNQKSEAKKLNKCAQGTKSDTKRVPKPLKLARNGPGFYREVSHNKSARNPGPADCAKRLQ